MAQQKWSLSGDYMESCNCDYLCPCIYTNPQGPATFDQCTAIMVFRVSEGRFGEVALDGLKFALVIRSGRVMADGNWIFAGIVEESAGEGERRALSSIVAGEAGGPPAVIRRHLVRDFRGVRYAPISFVSDGLKRKVEIGDLIAFEIEGVPSRNKSGIPYFIDNTAHPANRRLALARAQKLSVHAFGLDLDLAGKGNNGHYAPFSWSA